jgi:sigma-B regulation protein RsbU (phosphoserine phosphatase)
MEIGNLRFAWRFSPCDELGGDIFNAFALPGGRVGIYLLDVSGHGLPAALLSVTLSRLLTPVGAPSLVEELRDGVLAARTPGDVVAELNRRFPIEQNSHYFTMFYGVFDCQHSRLTYVSAGHPPALRISAGQSAGPLDGANFAVGWFDDATFDEQTISLAPGDSVVLYSDGIPETMNPGATHFGTDRLAAALDTRRGHGLETQLDGLMGDVETFRAGAEVCDDVTVLVMQCSCD